MTCRELIEIVEPIAAGDLPVSEAARSHLESCPRCASALASARRIEAALHAREAPPAPARFTPAVIARIRRERWRAEQQVDRLFNLAIVVAFVLVGGGTVALMNLSGVAAAAGAAWAVLAGSSGQVMHQATSVLGTYIAGAGLLISALGMWWWAERRLMV